MNIPNETEILDIVRANGSVIQFKNSLKFVQGSTSMSLERMNTALDLMCAMVYTEGMKAGLEVGKDIVKAEVMKK